MNRPKILHVGGTLYWVLRTRNPDTQVLKDADSTPTVAIRKNGASTGDSVTVTKRSATTGIYDCSYNPAGEVEGDEFTVEESATVTGTTTSQATYSVSWEFTAIALERGTDGANTTAPATPTNVSDAQTAILAKLPSALVGGRIDASVGAMAANTLTAAAIAPDAGAELAALVETYIVNEGDATAVMQAIADKIAADWIAGDASPVAVATAVWSVATRTITGGVLTTSPPTAAVIADAVWDEARSGHTTTGTFGEKVTAELDSASTTKLNKIEAVVAGTVTGAGTSTEVFVGPSATVTITVDSSGNRSAVVVS